MVFIFYWAVALCLAVPGLGAIIAGVVLHFQRNRRPAFIALTIGLILLLIALGIVGVSIYQINTICTVNTADCS